ncbi:hypothetical protein [Oceanidesulfovibrio marinus]|uniref:Uncharacterized protein n=1 Tax=Oceanidesulfovibrio marinus TaxID=370038 RepID=A0A6P1ZHD3_9BACT|nr:hypothetical protein [Oceanidesulfovibrio marinus]TVM32125.1 hypothetical protein DQK91_16480 [Oceanidesulfovibrio marinus]
MRHQQYMQISDRQWHADCRGDETFPVTLDEELGILLNPIRKYLGSLCAGPEAGCAVSLAWILVGQTEERLEQFATAMRERYGTITLEFSTRTYDPFLGCEHVRAVRSERNQEQSIPQKELHFERHQELIYDVLSSILSPISAFADLAYMNGEPETTDVLCLLYVFSEHAAQRLIRLAELLDGHFGPRLQLDFRNWRFHPWTTREGKTRIVVRSAGSH